MPSLCCFACWKTRRNVLFTLKTRETSLFYSFLYKNLAKRTSQGLRVHSDRQFLLHLRCLPQFSSVAQSCLTLWDPMDCSTPLSIANSRSSLKLMSIESVRPSNHLILCGPLLCLSSIFPRIRVLSSESPLRTGWPKYWSISFSTNPSNEYSGLISFRTDLWSPCSPRDSQVFPSTSVPKHQFFSA